MLWSLQSQITMVQTSRLISEETEKVQDTSPVIEGYLNIAETGYAHKKIDLNVMKPNPFLLHHADPLPSSSSSTLA